MPRDNPWERIAAAYADAYSEGQARARQAAQDAEARRRYDAETAWRQREYDAGAPGREADRMRLEALKRKQTPVTALPGYAWVAEDAGPRASLAPMREKRVPFVVPYARPEAEAAPGAAGAPAAAPAGGIPPAARPWFNFGALPWESAGAPAARNAVPPAVQPGRVPSVNEIYATAVAKGWTQEDIQEALLAREALLAGQEQELRAGSLARGEADRAEAEAWLGANRGAYVGAKTPEALDALEALAPVGALPTLKALRPGVEARLKRDAIREAQGMIPTTRRTAVVPDFVVPQAGEWPPRAPGAPAGTSWPPKLPVPAAVEAQPPPITYREEPYDATAEDLRRVLTRVQPEAVGYVKELADLAARAQQDQALADLRDSQQAVNEEKARVQTRRFPFAIKTPYGEIPAGTELDPETYLALVKKLADPQNALAEGGQEPLMPLPMARPALAGAPGGRMPAGWQEPRPFRAPYKGETQKEYNRARTAWEQQQARGRAKPMGVRWEDATGASYSGTEEQRQEWLRRGGVLAPPKPAGGSPPSGKSPVRGKGTGNAALDELRANTEPIPPGGAPEGRTVIRYKSGREMMLTKRGEALEAQNQGHFQKLADQTAAPARQEAMPESHKALADNAALREHQVPFWKRAEYLWLKYPHRSAFGAAFQMAGEPLPEPLEKVILQVPASRTQPQVERQEAARNTAYRFIADGLAMKYSGAKLQAYVALRIKKEYGLMGR